MPPEAPPGAACGLHVGARVRPTAQLRRWGPSAFDRGAVVTRLDARGGFARPLHSTRPKDVGAKGFGWLWSSRREYRFDAGDLEVDDDAETTGAAGGTLEPGPHGVPARPQWG